MSDALNEIEKYYSRYYACLLSRNNSGARIEVAFPRDHVFPRFFANVRVRNKRCPMKCTPVVLIYNAIANCDHNLVDTCRRGKQTRASGKVT